MRRLAGDAVRARASRTSTRATCRKASHDRARGARAADFQVNATVPLIVSEDIEAAADTLRPFYALYFGGMGAKGTNFHANVAIRMGYEQEVDEIAELYLAGKKDEAGAKVPRKLIEEMSLIGPREKIREDLERWRESIVTTLLDLGRRGDAAHGRRARARLSREEQGALAGRTAGKLYGAVHLSRGAVA